MEELQESHSISMPVSSLPLTPITCNCTTRQTGMDHLPIFFAPKCQAGFEIALQRLAKYFLLVMPRDAL